MGNLFTGHFAGMTEETVELADLEAARTQLLRWAADALSDSERRILRSVKQGKPDWPLLPFEGADK